MTDAPKRIRNRQFVSSSNDRMIVLILVSHLAGEIVILVLKVPFSSKFLMNHELNLQVHVNYMRVKNSENNFGHM